MAEIKRVIVKGRREKTKLFLYTGTAYVERLASEDSVMEFFNVTINDAVYVFSADDWDDAPIGSTFRNLSVFRTTYQLRIGDGTWVNLLP